MPQCEISKECGAAWAAASTPLDRARAVKLRLRAASKKATEARKAWTSARSLIAPRVIYGDIEAAGIVTLDMWAAEHALAAVAEEWRLCLAARAAMPKGERWNLAGVERWASIVDALGSKP